MAVGVVNIAVLVLLPIVSAILFEFMQVSVILLVCSIKVGIVDTFSLVLAVFDTNTFVIRCTS